MPVELFVILPKGGAMECPRCGFIEQRDVQCPKCDSLFNATDAEEWAHLDYLQSKLGEWRDRGLLPDQKLAELLALTDRELAAVEEILGIERDGDSADTTRLKPPPSSAPAPDEDKVLDAVDNALARGDTRQAERLLDSVHTQTEVGQLDKPPTHNAEQFEAIDIEVGLDMLFLVTNEGAAEQERENFRRAIVYAASPGEACRRLCSYIDLCNEAGTAQASDDEHQESDEEQVAAEPEEESGPIGYEPDLMIATLLATTTTRLDDENAFDADHILIFETDRNQ